MRVRYRSWVLAIGLLLACGDRSNTTAGPQLVLTVGVTTMNACPGASKLTVAEGSALHYCFRVFNNSNAAVTDVAVTHGAVTHKIATIDAWRSETIKISATAVASEKQQVTARGSGRSGAVASAAMPLELTVLKPVAIASKPPAPLSPPLTFPPVTTGQPHFVEGLKSDGSVRTCNGQPCACTGDRIRLRPKAGEQFPPVQTSFPGIGNDVYAHCFATQHDTWQPNEIIAVAPTAGNAPNARGSLFWIGLRRARGGLLDQCGPRPIPQQLPPGVGFRPRPIPNGPCSGCTTICVPNGSGGCLNELMLHDAAQVSAFYAHNGFPAYNPAIGKHPTYQYMTVGQSIDLRWRVASSATVTVKLFRDGQLITPAPPAGATQATVTGIQQATKFEIEIENVCGASRRAIQILPLGALVAEPDPLVIRPGESAPLTAKVVQAGQNPVDVRVTVHPELPPNGSDNFPEIYVDPTFQITTTKMLNVTMEDTNTGIADGTLVATIELTPTTAMIPSAWVPVRYKAPRATGFAELHAHPFSEVAFGADGLWGGAIHGSATAKLDDLDDCTVRHGPMGLSHAYGFFFSEFAPHGNQGFSAFTGWPSWMTGTHQQMHDDWLRRAQQGGLRLMVALAVDNQLSCAIHRSAIRTEELAAAGFAAAGDFLLHLDPVTLVPKALTITPFDPRFWPLLVLLGRFATAAATCTAEDQMASIDRQIDMARAFADRNSAWAEIAKDGADAKRIIDSGKLAVVIGIEVSVLFGCERDKCTKEKVEAAVDQYHAKGVRYIFPLHRADNAFGGAATLPLVFVDKQDCDEYKPAQCNPRGLTDLGRVLLDKLVAKGILIDIDHMGAQTKADTFQHLRTHHAGYPVFAGHATLKHFAKGGGLHDGTRTEADINFILASGGILAPIMDPSSTEETFAFPKDPILLGLDQARSCPHSTRSYKLQLDAAIAAMRGRPIAIGTDFNGFGGLPAPRYGDLRCHSGKGPDLGPPRQPWPEEPPWSESDYYPFELPFEEPANQARTSMGKSKINAREYDVRYDGVAHVGMLPDMMQEVGLDGGNIQNVMRSADAFARAWRKSDCIATQKAGKPVPHDECPR